MARATAGQLKPRTPVRFYLDETGRITTSAKGRAAVTRPQLPEYIPRSVDRINQLYHQRAQTGFPEPAGQDGRALLWLVDQVTAWWAQHTSVERVGDPDELLSAAQIATQFNYARPASIFSLIANGGFPDPDALDASARSDQDRKRWKRSTVWGYLEGRKFTRTRKGEPDPGLEAAPAAGATA